MKIKPATEANARQLQNALDALRIARDQLAAADCPQALAAVRRALKSAEGAERHMLRRLMPRNAEGEPMRRGSLIAPDASAPVELGDLSRLPIADQIRIRAAAGRGLWATRERKS